MPFDQRRTFWPLQDAAFHHAQKNDDAAVAVEPGIENQGAEGEIGRPFGRGHEVDDGLEDFVNADALFGAGEHGAGGIEADDGFNLLADALGLGRRQIDLVDHRHDFQVVMQREIRVRKRLRFDVPCEASASTTSSAPSQACRKRHGNFVGEIHVARRIDQIQLVHYAIVGAIVEAHGVGLDGDAALALEIHGIEHLLHHFALRQGAGGLEQTIRQRRFAVVDVRNDREIADEFAIHFGGSETIIP